jgi:hypothetical protein
MALSNALSTAMTTAAAALTIAVGPSAARPTERRPSTPLINLGMQTSAKPQNLDLDFDLVILNSIF